MEEVILKADTGGRNPYIIWKGFPFYSVSISQSLLFLATWSGGFAFISIILILATLSQRSHGQSVIKIHEISQNLLISHRTSLNKKKCQTFRKNCSVWHIFEEWYPVIESLSVGKSENCLSLIALTYHWSVQLPKMSSHVTWPFPVILSLPFQIPTFPRGKCRAILPKMFLVDLAWPGIISKSIRIMKNGPTLGGTKKFSVLP